MATMTRADVQARVQAQFAKRDANRDGFLTTEEMTRRGGQRDGAMKVRRMRGADGQPGAQRAMRDPNAAFDRLDANRDGSISRDEFARNRVIQHRAARRDATARASRARCAACVAAAAAG